MGERRRERENRNRERWRERMIVGERKRWRERESNQTEKKRDFYRLVREYFIHIKMSPLPNRRKSTQMIHGQNVRSSPIFGICMRTPDRGWDDVMAYERLQNLGLSSVLIAYEQGGIFLARWHGTSVCTVSTEGPPSSPFSLAFLLHPTQP